ncbi:MAG: P-loop NTPase fold protein, partial [Leptothrix sp. (in: b-proteobacteria)]
PNAAAPALATLRALHVVEPPANDETGASAQAWAVGGDGTVLRIGSDAIEAPMKLAPDDELRAVRFNAAGTTGWAVGDKGVIAIWQAASGRKTRAGWSYEATDLPGDWRGLWTSANADSMWFAGVSPGLVSRAPPGPGASATGSATSASGTGLGASGGGWWVPAWPQRHRVYPAPWYALALLLSGAMVWWAFRVRAPRRDEGINAMSATDAPTATFDEDRLAFGPLARGISRYLRNEKTQPPLTLAVQGDWGVGKSSLMSLLCTDLRRYGYRPVWFNAWHHQSDEQMLAGLLAAIQRQGVPPWLGIEGLAFRLRLVWARGRQYLIASLLLLWLLALAAGYVHGHSEVETTQLLDLVGGWLKAIAALFDGKAPPPDTNQLVKPLVPLGGLLFMGSMVYRYLNLFGVKPGVLVSQAARQLSAKDAEAAAGFRARFATQFAQVADSLRPQRLVIVIDDLDRCRPEAVLSVMESVNFLVSSGKCFVVFGMSKPIVEASLSLSFEKVAKELAVMEDATDAAGAPLSDEERRRRFVRRYLEKLVNVEISVPERRDLPAYALLAPDEAAPTPAWHWRALRTALPVLLVVFVAGLGWNLGHVADGRLLVTSTTARQIATSSAPAKSVSARTRPNTVVGELVSRLPGSPVQTESADLDPMGWLVFALPLALLVLGSLAYAVLTLRTARIVVQDSAPFQAALRIWSPLAHQRLATPRAIKRFGNRIRYLAMLHQAETMDHSRLDALPAWLAASLRAVLQPGSRPKATAATPGTGAEAAPPVRNEPMVVALGALHEVYGAGWRARLQASVDDPAGVESLLDQTLAEAIRLH